MSGVLSGASILAGASASSSSLSYKDDDLQYDLALLTATDTHPLDPVALATDKEEALRDAATANAQLLIKRIFELPVEPTESGPVVRPQ
jgi:hypothetical protein